MITKKIITESLNELKKYNWDVKNFNSKNKMPIGCKGFVDFVLMNEKKGYVIFIEVKLYKDKASEKQSEYQTVCENIGKINHHFKYYIMTEKNYKQIIEGIIKKT